MGRATRQVGFAVGVALLLHAGGLAAQGHDPIARDGGSAMRVVSGRVVEAGSTIPLALVRVTVAGRPGTQALTDSVGRFRLALPFGEVAVLRFRRLGYVPVERILGPGSDGGPVMLEPLRESLEARIITAARREERLADAVVATELIGAGEIARSGASDLAALLEKHVGIQPDGGVPAGVGVTLQGMGAQRVLVLVDGQPVVGRVGGNLDVTRLPLSLVERVEVVKGPQSTLYGSDAMGGVVNLVTRGASSDDPALGVGTLVGTAGRREVHGHVGLAGEAWRLRIDGGGGVVALTPGIASDAGTRSRRIHLAPRLERRGSGGARGLSFTALLVDESQRYRSGQLYQFSDNTQLNARVGAERRWGANRAEPTLAWSRYEHLSRRATTPLPASDSGARDVQQLIQMELPVTLAFDRAVVDAGVTLKRESIEADRVPGGERRLHAAEPYAQATWGRASLSYTLGGRVTMHERWGSVVAPRLAALWRPREAIALRFGLGSGYRAPDFKELYLSFANTAAGYAVEGNPSLVPERSANATVTLSLTGVRSSMRVGAHFTRYRDFIETGSPDATGTYTYDNVARGTTGGIEWEGTVSVAGVRLDAAHTWLRTRDAATGSPLLGRAAHVASGGLRARTLGVDWNARVHWSGRAPVGRDESTGALAWRGEFARVDLAASSELPWGATLRSGVTNVLDRAVDATWPGFTGRQWYVGVGLERDRDR